jgi:hypothetical protein
MKKINEMKQFIKLYEEAFENKDSNEMERLTLMQEGGFTNWTKLVEEKEEARRKEVQEQLELSMFNEG